MSELLGRHLPDRDESEIPAGVQAGDYWKLTDAAGVPLHSDAPSNLTGTVWYVAAPIGDADGFAIGLLALHTVREHEDGTISVRQGDGSSNSILIRRGARGLSWHGYIEHGVWRPV